MVLRQVLVSDQSQPLRLRRLNGRLQFLGGTRQALAVDARRVRKDVRGSVTPLALRERGTRISPYVALDKSVKP